MCERHTNQFAAGQENAIESARVCCRTPRESRPSSIQLVHSDCCLHQSLTLPAKLPSTPPSCYEDMVLPR